jgi:hypothetical protein
MMSIADAMTREQGHAGPRWLAAGMMGIADAMTGSRPPGWMPSNQVKGADSMEAQ